VGNGRFGAACLVDAVICRRRSCLLAFFLSLLAPGGAEMPSACLCRVGTLKANSAAGAGHCWASSAADRSDKGGMEVVAYWQGLLAFFSPECSAALCPSLTLLLLLPTLKMLPTGWRCGDAGGVRGVSLAALLWATRHSGTWQQAANGVSLYLLACLASLSSPPLYGCGGRRVERSASVNGITWAGYASGRAALALVCASAIHLRVRGRGVGTGSSVDACATCGRWRMLTASGAKMGSHFARHHAPCSSSPLYSHIVTICGVPGRCIWFSARVTVSHDVLHYYASSRRRGSSLHPLLIVR